MIMSMERGMVDGGLVMEEEEEEAGASLRSYSLFSFTPTPILCLFRFFFSLVSSQMLVMLCVASLENTCKMT